MAQVRVRETSNPQINSLLDSCVFYAIFISGTLISANLFLARSGDLPASNWIPPAERYAVVPDETLGLLARRLHQTANVSSHLQPNIVNLVRNFKHKLACTRKHYPCTRGPPVSDPCRLDGVQFEGGELEVPGTRDDASGDANVPDTDTKRMRTTL